MSYKLFCIFACWMLFGATLQASVDVKGMRKLESFGRQQAKKYQMRYLNKGVGTIVDSPTVAWDISLVGPQKLTLEQARTLIVCMLDEFLTLVTKDPLFDEYLKNEKKLLSWYDPVLSPKRIGIKLAFWDENVDRYPSPYISQIKAMEGKVFYYQANPKDQSLVEVRVETFEEAFAKGEI